MQVTTATRTVEIYANNESYVTYRNTKDGKAYGPVRTASVDSKAGSVGREVFDAARAAVAPAAQEEVVEVVIPAAEVAEVVTETVRPAGRNYSVTAQYLNPVTREAKVITDWYATAETARAMARLVTELHHAELLGTSENVFGRG